MVMTYWEIGRRIIELEQKGSERAHYGDGVISRLAVDLTDRYGRGFSRRNLYKYRDFYLWKSIVPTLSAVRHFYVIARLSGSVVQPS